MSYDERKATKDANKSAKVRAAQQLEFVKGLMVLPAGRSYIYDLLSSCHVFATTFSGNALQSAFSEGERNIGLRILADIMLACPERYLLMVQEQNARDLTNQFADSVGTADPAEPDGGDSGPVEDDASRFVDYDRD